LESGKTCHPLREVRANKGMKNLRKSYIRTTKHKKEESRFFRWIAFQPVHEIKLRKMAQRRYATLLIKKIS